MRLWDLQVRLCHWVLAAAVAVSIVTGEIGGPLMVVHQGAGLVGLAALSFRITWGFIGSGAARFSSFLPSITAIRTYLAGRWQGVGHNPLGACSVFAMLAALAAQVATGLFSGDDVAFEGPLCAFVRDATCERLTGWHHRLAPLVLALIALHLGAVAWHVRSGRRRLVRDMFNGGRVDTSDDPPLGWMRSTALAASISVACVAVASGKLLSALLRP